MSHISSRRRLFSTLIIIMLCLLITTTGWVPIPSAQFDSSSAGKLWGRVWSADAERFSPDSVTAAWERLQEAGSYRFTSNVVQTTIPTAKITNVGRLSRTEQLYLEGQSDLTTSALEFRIWSDGGSVLQEGSSVAVRVMDGSMYVRQGNGEWTKSRDVADAIAPQGDFIGYLSATRNVTAHEPETVAGIEFTRYSFELDGPKFAAYMRTQMEAALRTRGELPVGIRFELSPYYRHMTGEGELWVREDGLPLRQILNVRFPEQDNAHVNAEIQVDFSNFGQYRFTNGEFVAHDPAAGNAVSVMDVVRQVTNGVGNLLALALLLMICAIVIYYRRARILQTALTSALITSMVAGPLLSTLQIASFFDAQSARAATQSAELQKSNLMRDMRTVDPAPAHNPHQSLLAAPMLQATGFLTQETNVHSDSDGLTDFIEQRIGTSVILTDTDGDLITDNVEVKGFSHNGKQWYLDPLAADSNADGLADTEEAGDLSADPLVPLDTDGDGVPDLFDDDNDNDRVPDRLDLAPFAKAGTFSESDPFELSISNLTVGKPTFVDFQIKPTDGNGVWFASNVVDWPRDRQAQFQDVDDGTYADYAVANGLTPGPNDDFGDLKLTPMLEIRVPSGSQNLPSKEILQAYQILYNDLDTSSTEHYLYLPLSVVTDGQSGERVAFAARMRYLRDTAGETWTNPHKIRLAWTVQMLQDIPCDLADPNLSGPACVDGYQHNVPQVIHTYYDSWQLTGINVREEYGADVSVIYEDPAVDQDSRDEAALTVLTAALERTFLAGRDCDAPDTVAETCGGDGLRDLTVHQLHDRFDRTSTNRPAESDPERMGIKGSLDILTVTPSTTFETFDWALTSLITKTNDVLTEFQGDWQQDNAVKPLILYAFEQRYRSLGLDALRATVAGSQQYVSLQGNQLSVDLQPSDEDPVPIQVLAGMKWAAYCADAGSGPAWRPCEVVEYWQELETRYASGIPAEFPDSSDADVARGRLALTQLYWLTVMQGITGSVANQSDEQAQEELITPTATFNFASISYTAEIATIENGLNAAKMLTVAVVNYFTLKQFTEVVQARVVTTAPPPPNIEVLRGVGRTFDGRPDKASFARVGRVLNSNTGGKLLLLSGTTVVLGLAVTGGLLASSSNTQEKLAGGILLQSLAISAVAATQVALPIASVVEATRAAEKGAKLATLGSALASRSEVIGVSRTANAVGAVIGIGITWGFFVYDVVSNDIEPGSVAFNFALATTIASTVYIILLTVISATIVGIILVGLLSVFDALATLFCETGVVERQKDGTCFTIGGVVVKAIADLLYTHSLIVKKNDANMINMGVPDVDLVEQEKGFVIGNVARISIPVTTTVTHKNPQSQALKNYTHYMSQGYLKSTTFKYQLSSPDEAPFSVERSEMSDQWTLSKNGKWCTHFTGACLLASSEVQLYKAVHARSDYSIDIPMSSPGLNVTFPFYVNAAYALPGYDCWGLLDITDCDKKTVKGNNSTLIDVIQFDVLPASISEFMRTSSRLDGGFAFDWDSKFTSLHDADGDGLISLAHNGNDPNDRDWDADSDGLADAFELIQRQNGIPVDPIFFDGDNDGLSDFQELEFGTNPANDDTDNDGLLDGEEVWHQIQLESGSTSAFTGGWEISVPGISHPVRVSSDPTRWDSDGDGVSDGAERAFALGESGTPNDEQNRPYHPNVVNGSPVKIYGSSDIPDGRYVKPGQNFNVGMRVLTTVPLAPGMLDVTVPGVLGQSPPPLALPFDDQTFDDNQTVTKNLNLTASSGAGTRDATITSLARVRLAPTGPSVWEWNTFGTASLGTLPATTRHAAATPLLTSQPDSYMIAVLTSDRTSPGGFGSVFSRVLPGGTGAEISPPVTASRRRGYSTPDVACNDNGVCMMVWDDVIFSSSGPPVSVAAGALVNAQGQRIAHLNIPNPNNMQSFAPVVASDGTNFLMAHEIAQGANTVIRLLRFAPDGSILNNVSQQVETARPVPDTINGVSMDLIWVSDRYRIVYKFIRSDRFDGQHLIVQEINADATFAHSITEPQFNGLLARGDALGAPALAFDPVNPRTAFIYHQYIDSHSWSVRHFAPLLIRIQNNEGRLNNIVSQNHAPHLVYDPMARGWAISRGNSGQTRVTLWNPNLEEKRVAGELLALSGAGSRADLALACPALTSLPLVDLRFEETPVASSFTDSSIWNRHGTCSGANCPDAGAQGAVDSNGNAIGKPASDYSVAFNGSNDSLTVPNPLSGDFSISFWYKANATSGGTAFNIGSNHPNGFGLFIYNNTGVVEWWVGGTRSSANSSLNNGQWHLVVATYTEQTKALQLFIDGNSSITTTTAQSPVMGANINMGAGSTRVNLDNFQLHSGALNADAINNIYGSSTATSHCIAVDYNNGLRAARFNAARSDNRGPVIHSPGEFVVTIDADAPSAAVTTPGDGGYVQGTQGNTSIATIGGTASDPTSFVSSVEVNAGNGWQPAEGLEAWAFQVPVTEGSFTVRARATDAVGRLGAESAAVRLIADATPPTIATTLPSPAILVAGGSSKSGWTISLGGTVNDPNIGSDAGSGVTRVDVALQASSSQLSLGSQPAFFQNGTWTIDYKLPSHTDPSDTYTVTVSAADAVGNLSGDIVSTIAVDTSGPDVALSLEDENRRLISDTITIGGVISETGDAGLSSLQISFEPVEEIAVLPENIPPSEALSQTTWLDTVINTPGSGSTISTWQYTIPSDLEGEYQINLRTTDTLDNERLVPYVWRGIIDTRAPRVALTRTEVTTYFDEASNQSVGIYQYECRAEDRYLDVDLFDCPVGFIRPADRGFDNNPVLQELFPDRTIVNLLTNSGTIQESVASPDATLVACDIFGRCSSETATSQVLAASYVRVNKALPFQLLIPFAVTSATSASTTPTSTTSDVQTPRAAAVPDLPRALVLAPLQERYVASDDNSLSITILAEATEPLKEVTIKLDDDVQPSLTFDQSENILRTQRTIRLENVAQGERTLEVQASDWNGNVQQTLSPVTFVLDTENPTVTLDTDTLGLGDTWSLGSDVLRFHGTATDAEGLAAVQIKVGNADFAEANFGGGLWSTALHVPDPEGKSLAVIVRAIDRAGRISSLSETIGVDLTPTETTITPPDTTITPTVVNAGVNSVTVRFSGMDGTYEVAAFECRLDAGEFQPCVSPTTYDDLNNGVNRFEVRAIDDEGFVDPTPASEEWTIAVTTLQTSITESPSNPTESRDATFVFTGSSGVTSFECALDGAAFTACTSPQSYTGVRDGEHTFQVRGLGGGNTGAATRYSWTVNNAAPVAESQAVSTTEGSDLAIALVATDADPLSYKVGSASNGVLLGESPTLTYRPDTGFSGTDSFTFVANDGQLDSNVATVTITVIPLNKVPVADAGGPYSITEGEDLNLDATGSIDEDGDPLTYSWDINGDNIFGDITGTQPSLTWAELTDLGIDDGTSPPLTRTVTVEVADLVSFDRASVDLIIANAAPQIEAGADQTANEGELVTLETATFTDAGLVDTHTATIDWGDGSALDSGNVTQEAGSGSVAGLHVYATEGEYTVTVCVTDNDGDEGCDTLVVVVSNLAPTIDAGSDITVDEGTALELEPSTFYDQGTLDTHTATIDWGDGSTLESRTVTEALSGPPGSTDGITGTVAFPAHIYADNGSYTVSICVADDHGDEGCDTLLAEVDNVAPTVDAGLDQIIYEGDILTLDPTTFSDPGFDNALTPTEENFSVTIDWGDGQQEPAEGITLIETPGAATISTTGTVSASHQYLASPGTYTVSVAVTDDDGATTTDTLQVTVVHGFLRFCAYGDDSAGVKLEQDVSAECAQTFSGVPGELRVGGIGARGGIELKDSVEIMGNLVSLNEKVDLGKDAQLQGGIAAGNDVKIEERAAVQESIVSGGKVDVKKNALVQGDITAGDEIKVDETATVGGIVSPNTQPPAIPDITSALFTITPGSQNVTVPKNGTQSLSPDTAYGDVKIEEGGTVIFSAGHFTLNKLDVKKEAFIHFDLTNGPIIVDVAESTDMAENVQMEIVSTVGDATDILFRVGKDVKLKKDGLFLGTYLAPDGDITLEQNSVVTGALYGKKVDAKKQSRLIGLPARNLFASLFVDPGINTVVSAAAQTEVEAKTSLVDLDDTASDTSTEERKYEVMLPFFSR